MVVICSKNRLLYFWIWTVFYGKHIVTKQARETAHSVWYRKRFWCCFEVLHKITFLLRPVKTKPWVVQEPGFFRSVDPARHYCKQKNHRKIQVHGEPWHWAQKRVQIQKQFLKWRGHARICHEHSHSFVNIISNECSFHDVWWSRDGRRLEGRLVLDDILRGSSLPTNENRISEPNFII